MLQIIVDTLKETTVVGNAEHADGVHISDNVQALLDVLGDECLSAKELMERLGFSHRPTFRKKYLTPALNLGVIAMTIPDKPQSRNQRYYKA